MTPPDHDRLAALDRAHVWHPFTAQKDWAAADPLIIERAEGVYLIDTKGNRYLDGVSSLWCNVHGHRHPEIDAAVRGQLDRVAHSTMLGLTHPAAIDLAEAARGAALLDALHTLTAGTPDPELAARERASAACAVVRTLVDAGLLRDRDSGEAVDALARAGIVEQALLEGAVAETEDLLDKIDEAHDDERPPEPG